jgi:myo-inositol-1(or 4)-monophosphatase
VPGPGRPESRYDELRDVATNVALEAAELVLRRRDEQAGRRAGAKVDVAATKTSQLDVVTEVDRESEAFLRDRLARLRPGDGFLGEEGGSGDSRSGVTWVVDPIDGTVNFLYGMPGYAVSVAAVEGDGADQRPVAGAVVDVMRRETYSASLGGGATRDGRPLRLGPAPPLDRFLVGTGFHYRLDVRSHQGPAVAALLQQVRDVRRRGSAAMDVCDVASGRLDAHVEEGLNLWDRAAASLVATEAGARVEVRLGAGGLDCVVCAPLDGFDAFAALVERCGFLAQAQPGQPEQPEQPE